MVIELRKEQGITKKLKNVPLQKHKLPRHVIQKTLEILTKINKYREINNYGPITVPPVPSRNITPEDVFNNVERLKVEVSYLLKDKDILNKKAFILQKYKGKKPSDVYRVLWTISMGFDEILGQGFTPTDVYIQSQKVVNKIKFLRSTQRENTTAKKPKLLQNQHPNHALYKSIDLLAKINLVEKKLWMKPVPIPHKEDKVVSPTEVYDSLQTVNAELNRISRRLGVERSFDVKEPKSQKTPADVVQNLAYAICLLPSFDFDKRLNQYPKKSLIKTPNDVYALSEFILQKIKYIKVMKGIHTHIKQTPYLYGLKPIHVYTKGLEDLEKVAKLKKLEGFKASQVPSSPNTKITPSEVYELILRLDDEITMIYGSDKLSEKDRNFLICYRDKIDKKTYSGKTPSDAYSTLWKISYELDSILNQDYTPNETYILAKKIEADIGKIVEHFLKKHIEIQEKKHKSKKPKDVFNETVILLDKLQRVKVRDNIQSAKISIPKDSIITPTSVYNALRIISGTVSEVRVDNGVESVKEREFSVQNKTPSDVYSVVEATNKLISNLLEDKNYED
jgi:hypothetical protein